MTRKGLNVACVLAEAEEGNRLLHSGESAKGSLWRPACGELRMVVGPCSIRCEIAVDWR